jgi:hypothetical protein
MHDLVEFMQELLGKDFPKYERPARSQLKAVESFAHRFQPTYPGFLLRPAALGNFGRPSGMEFQSALIPGERESKFTLVIVVWTV